ELMNSAAGFLKDTPLKTKLVIIASLTSMPTEMVEDAMAGIKLRNDIVHDGSIPEEKHLKDIRALLAAAARLVPGPRMKFPVHSENNCLAEPAQWQCADGWGPISAA